MEQTICFFILIVIGVAASAISIYSIFKWKGSGRYLCEDCRFNDPALCLKADRPVALQCTSYRPGELSANMEGK